MLGLPKATDAELREALGSGFPKHPLHKIVCIGALVALTACLTGLTAQPSDDTGRLLSRGFVRGVIAIMLTSLVFSLAA